MAVLKWGAWTFNKGFSHSNLVSVQLKGRRYQWANKKKGKKKFFLSVFRLYCTFLIVRNWSLFPSTVIYVYIIMGIVLFYLKKIFSNCLVMFVTWIQVAGEQVRHYQVSQLKFGDTVFVCLFVYMLGHTYHFYTLTLVFLCQLGSQPCPIPHKIESCGLLIITGIIQ